MASASSAPTTLEYKRLKDGTPILMDVYPPQTNNTATPLRIPALVYFHGGGLTVGNRKSWFPQWLKERVVARGMLFISADYQLIPPATGHDIVQDIKDLFAYLASNTLFLDSNSFSVDPDAIVVAGTSAGGLCAYLAASHCVEPRPKVVMSMYGMGGDFLTPHYLEPKTSVFFRGRELLDPEEYKEFTHPLHAQLSPISDSPLAYHSQTYKIPGFPSNPRMLLARLYLQMGDFLDYYTGQHEPSLSQALRTDSLDSPSNARMLIPEPIRDLFPQFNVTPSWPPTLLIHGTADTAVPIAESRNMFKILSEAGVPVELMEFEGKEHSFDYEPDAATVWGDRFDRVMEFVLSHLKVDTTTLGNNICATQSRLMSESLFDLYIYTGEAQKTLKNGLSILPTTVMPAPYESITHGYKTLPNGAVAQLDVFLPGPERKDRPLSAVLYFHGGGLAVGDRGTAVPGWLKDWALGAGHLFVSADYQLLPPSTAHDVVQDVQDALSYIANTEFHSQVDPSVFYRVNPDSIVVSGSSAGGTCSFLAALHCTNPKPKAILSIYGMGGDMLAPIYFKEKTEPFYQEMPLLDLADFSAFVYPESQSLEKTAASATTFRADVHPPNPRAALFLLYIQMGRFLDYYTGQHTPSLSKTIQEAYESGGFDAIPAVIPAEHRRLFPQLQLADRDAQLSWPPTLLIHGTADTVVNISESRNLFNLLRARRIPVDLVEFEGQDHVFDYGPDFVEIWKVQYQKIITFLASHLL